MKQDALYEQAPSQTADLYHLRPQHTRQITIGEPDEADKKYMTGLSSVGFIFWILLSSSLTDR